MKRQAERDQQKTRAELKAIEEQKRQAELAKQKAIEELRAIEEQKAELAEQRGEQKRQAEIAKRRYIDNGNGTVTDTRSGLIWLKNANCFGRQKWEAAMQSAAKLAHGQCGLSDGSKAGDWRLPTKKEWDAMIDKR